MKGTTAVYVVPICDSNEPRLLAASCRPTTSLSGMSSNMRVTPAEARLLPGGGRRLLDDPQPKADTTGTPPDTPPGTEATGTQATTPTDGQPATGATPGQTQPGDQASTAGGQGTTGEGAGGPQPQAFCSVRCISEARAVRVSHMCY